MNTDVLPAYLGKFFAAVPLSSQFSLLIVAARFLSVMFFVICLCVRDTAVRAQAGFAILRVRQPLYLFPAQALTFTVF